ncbi:MAG: hypothetical protein EOO16_05115 [Chitinophagaceae bacterium]|nr:MAG: hypothetical protein EOO16_05115 [Chitinophagaceae bacterium]
MATITNTNSNYIRTSVSLQAASAQPGAFARFINWADGQEQYRFGWVAGILAAHGCVMTPITLIAIVLGGNNIFLWVAAIVAMGAALVANLAAQPMKVTIPVFFTSLVVDLAIIASCLAAIAA